MALSGSFYTNVGSYWRLQLEWTATQDVANNQSTVTAKLYWISLSSAYGAVYSSATKTAAVIIAGTTTTNATTAALTGGQKKLIETQVKTITHAADGTASVALDGYFDAEVTLSGTYYGRIDLTGQSPALNTIPRASSLTSSDNWTAGDTLPVTISRATTSFTHTLKISVNGILIKTVTGIGTSTTVTFTLAENKAIFTQLAQTASKTTSLVLDTYSGATLIGSKTYAGVVTAPTASVLATGFDAARWIDETFPVSLTRKNATFLHTLTLTMGTFTKTTTGVATSNIWTWTQLEMDSMYSQIPNAKIGDGTLSIQTFYDGVKVRSTVTQAVTLHVRNLEPVFAASQISYADVAAAVTAITGNAQIIVQSKSSLTAYVNTTAVAQKSATITSYVVTVGSKTGNISTATGNVSLGAIEANVDQNLSIKAVDSRGFETIVSKVVTIAPWSPQTGSVTLTRLNKFEASTTLKISGNFSPVTIAAIAKNAITGLTYRYAPKGTTTWTTAVAKTPTMSGSTFATTDTVITLDNTKAYDFEIVATDRFGSVTFKASVTAGQPIMFMDSVKKSVGVGKFPTEIGTFEVGGKQTVQAAASTKPTAFENQIDGSLRVSNVNGYVDISPKNTTYAHFYTDRSSFYFDKPMTVIGNLTATNFITTGRVEAQYLRLTGTLDANATSAGHAFTIGSDTTGDSLKMDTNEISSFTTGVPAAIHVNTDGGDIVFANNTLSPMKYEPATGNLLKTRYKYQNGYNELGVRDGTTTNNDTYIIQNVLGTVAMGGTAQAFADVVFPVSFADAPLWIVAMPVNVNSASYKAAVYAPTTTNCRVYMSQIHNGVYTGDIQVMIVACGRKPSTFA